MKTLKTTLVILSAVFALVSCETDEPTNEVMQIADVQEETSADADTDDATVDILNLLTNGSSRTWTSSAYQFLDTGEFFAEDIDCTHDLGLINFTFNADGSYTANTAYQAEADGECELFDEYEGEEFLIMDDVPEQIEIVLDPGTVDQYLKVNVEEETITEYIILNGEEAIIIYTSN